jgi:glycosyltransferase involved in cell wall biosynthesis
MTNITILLPNLRGGGAERVMIDLAREFARLGHTVEFVLMQATGEFLQEARNHFPVVDLGVARARSMLFPLAGYLRQRRPDAVLAAMWPLTVIAPLALRLSAHQCKLLVSEHCNLSAQYRDWGVVHRRVMKASMAVGYRLADHRVAVSGGVADDISRLSGIRRGAFDVIHNPVPARPAPGDGALAAAEALWSAPPSARIVTVGTMKAQKNHPLLLRAFARLNRPDARLMFVGDGDGRAALLSLAQELGLADRVILAGFHPDPSPFYATADLFVLSSDYEGFGNVIVEALSFGLPVVSTDCPSGPAEILGGGRWGRLVPVGDAAALARAMDETLAAPVDRDALRRRAADFAPEIAARKYLELLGLA